MIKKDIKKSQIEINEEWFFNGGSDNMNRLERVCYLVEECGWHDETAMDMVYGIGETKMSDYRRLTMEGSIFDNIINCVVCPNKTENYNCRKDKTNCLNAVINRLAELEDKIENGTLVELPCKVGDKLFIIAKLVNSGEWVLSNDYSVGDFIVTDIYLNINREPKFKVNSYTIKLSDFGKTIFLTKTEAEKKLRELKGEV